LLYHASDKSYRESINSLSKTDQKRVKLWIRKLLSILKRLNDITDLTNIKISNYTLYKECGPKVNAKIGKDEMYRISLSSHLLFKACCC
jgi:hypothetical protein